MTFTNFRLPLVLASVLLASSASAQDTTILFANFESGVPAGWTVGGAGPNQWHLAQNGECGAVTRMMAFNAGSPACNYSGAQTSASFATPVFVQIGIPPWRIAFDYVLDIDAIGDEVGLTVLNSLGQEVQFTTTADFVNDGALHSVMFDVNTFGGPFGTRLSFHAATDGVGDQGRGWLIDNVRFSSTAPGSLYCVGGTANCPCGNGGGIQRGCANSVSFGTALRSSGVASISADSYALGATDIPPSSPALFFSGTAQSSSQFGDGLRCAGGTVVRLGTKSSPSGNAVYPEPGDVSISVRSLVPAGATRFYQVMYRDTSGPCGTGFNLSNGWQTTWAP